MLRGTSLLLASNRKEARRGRGGSGIRQRYFHSQDSQTCQKNLATTVVLSARKPNLPLKKVRENHCMKGKQGGGGFFSAPPLFCLRRSLSFGKRKASKRNKKEWKEGAWRK